MRAQFHERRRQKAWGWVLDVIGQGARGLVTFKRHTACGVLAARALTLVGAILCRNTEPHILGHLPRSVCLIRSHCLWQAKLANANSFYFVPLQSICAMKPLLPLPKHLKQPHGSRTLHMYPSMQACIFASDMHVHMAYLSDCNNPSDLLTAGLLASVCVPIPSGGCLKYIRCRTQIKNGSDRKGVLPRSGAGLLVWASLEVAASASAASCRRSPGKAA